ncbi:MAG TPA: polysaccharide ABC transporter ATP-binding protein [Vicinamibacterales bacterium]|jgi:lipopolysaccharide transport system ATP-binding protein
MDNLVVDGLGKCYVLARETEGKATRSVWQRLKSPLGADPAGVAREFWALKNVSFRVEPGTILGVIGANGAGKTTLLKILARVITPTTGRVVGVGRVVSLLELGAGFDPDLSARENILMNAAIIGITRHEAQERIPEILEFAEVEQFGSTPLRHYSSGMYLRLAFSVAIHMQPQILLADEILAVGDSAFQERCLQKVTELGRQGLTVLFVSHDMDAILRICNRVMWLNRGELRKAGDPEEVVDEYQNAVWSEADIAPSERGRRSNRLAEILSVRLVSAAGRDIGGAPASEDVFIKIRFRTVKPNLLVKCALDLATRGTLIFRNSDAEARPLRDAGVYEALVRIPRDLLAELTYVATVGCIFRKEDELKEFPLLVYNALSFMVYATEQPDIPTSGRLDRVGVIAPRLDWTVREEVQVVRA